MSIATNFYAQAYALPSASRYTAANGVFYGVCGASLLAWPEIIQVVFLDPTFIGHDKLFVHLSGFLLAMIGWLFVFGAFSSYRPFVAGTVIARLLFVPPVLGTLAIIGLYSHILGTFAVLDPTLAVGGWLLLSHDAKTGGMHQSGEAAVRNTPGNQPE